MSSLVTPARGKYTLLGLLIGTSCPASSSTIFGSAMVPPRGLAAQDVVEVEADRLLQLSVGARARRAVRAPADELRGVPEPRALHVVVADLDHALGPQRDEPQVLAHVPPAVLGTARRADALCAGRGGDMRAPVPRMALERRHERLKL